MRMEMTVPSFAVNFAVLAAPSHETAAPKDSATKRAGSMVRLFRITGAASSCVSISLTLPTFRPIFSLTRVVPKLSNPLTLAPSGMVFNGTVNTVESGDGCPSFPMCTPSASTLYGSMKQ